jgi:hypothetical protein
MTTSQRLATSGIVLAIGVLASLTATAAQETGGTCRECHAQESVSGLAHTLQWKSTWHGQAGVSCTACHRGDSSGKDATTAHVGILPRDNVRSSIYPDNLSVTCGRCHEDQRKGFERSRHARMLEQQRQIGPTCITCHGATAIRVEPARAIATCSQCHVLGSTSTPGLPEQAHTFLVALSQLRVDIEIAGRLVRAQRPGTNRRARAERLHAAVQTEVTKLAQSIHSFEWVNTSGTALGPARDRLIALETYLFGVSLQ